MKKYIPGEIEPKWQKKWEEDKLYQVDLSDPKNRQYVLVEFSYPSGDLHMGHWFAFAVPDILARFKRMQGYNVFFPNGFDACVYIAPTLSQSGQGININNLGALYYLSKRAMNTLWVKLYFFNQAENFKLVY